MSDQSYKFPYLTHYLSKSAGISLEEAKDALEKDEEETAAAPAPEVVPVVENTTDEDEGVQKKASAFAGVFTKGSA